MQPVADFEQAQRRGAHGRTQARASRAASYRMGSPARVRSSPANAASAVASRNIPSLTSRLAVALGRRGNVHIVVFRVVVLHTPRTCRVRG